MISVSSAAKMPLSVPIAGGVKGMQEKAMMSASDFRHSIFAMIFQLE